MRYEKGRREQKLNLGCGNDIRDGWVNLDIAHVPGVDVVHNVENVPLPFENESFSEILCNDILEHIEYIPVLKDLHRILEPGGLLHIRVPHFTSRNNALDPTHRRTFSVETFDFFDKATDRYREFGSYMFDFAFARAAREAHIDFEHSDRLFWYNRFVEPFVNKSKRRQQRYEQTGLSRLFPAQNILLTLQK